MWYHYHGHIYRISGNGGGNDTVLHIYNEDLTTQSGNTFNTSYVYLENTLRVYLNGLRKRPTTYTEDRLNSQFTTTFTVLDTDEFVIDYNYTLSEQAVASGGWGVGAWGIMAWGS